MAKCTIQAEYSGPNGQGDYVVTVDDKLRGKFNFLLSQGSQCFSDPEAVKPTPPPTPPETEETAKRGPGRPRKESLPE